MSRDLLLEIGLEEMPSAFMAKALEDYKDLAIQKLNDKRIAFDTVQTLGTPRRLVLHVSGLEENQQDALIETRGPKKASAFDSEGNPSKAALGFARGQGMDVKELVLKEVDGIKYVFAVKKEVGVKTETLLPDLLLDIIYSLSFPKSMRWSYYQTRFARPVRWLLAMYGNDPLSIQVENVKSEQLSYGHRFLAPEAFAVKSIEAYFALLRERYVIVDQSERKNIIWKQVQEAAVQAGGGAMENEDLLEEVTFLVEYPTAFVGNFSASYLEVPPEVLTTSMIEHQRYFPVFQDDKLLPCFVGVRNGTDYSLDLVKAGNERVIKARLEDALFFWKEDTGKALEELVPGLKNVMFHERLGSLMDKVDRLQKLAVFIGRQSNLSTTKKIERAAYLCKADLLSNMVYEFPELQGIMGRYYARCSGEDEEVAEAVLEHYLPRFAGDRLASTPTGIVLALTERIDNLTACFAIGIRPSGSQDPYALRRQALGIVNILLDLQLSVDLKEFIGTAYLGLVNVKTEGSQEQICSEVMDFILQRLRGVMLDKGFAYDVVDAVLAESRSDLNDLQQRLQIIQDFKTTPAYEDFMVVYNRSHNLSKKWDSTIVKQEVLSDDSEKELYKQYMNIKEPVLQAISRADYAAALEQLAELRPALDQFFAAVMVMVDDEPLKATRLGMLKSIAELCNMVADFSKLI